MEGFTCIGNVARAVGLKGDIVVRLNARWQGWETINTVYFSEQNLPKPLGSCHFSTNGDDLKITCAEIPDRTAAESLRGKQVFVPEDQLQRAALPFMHLINYTVVDEELGDLGTIESVEEFPGQWLATVVGSANRWMLPLNNDFISEEDDNHNVLTIRLPKGYFEAID